MESKEELISQLISILSDISHPLEGTSYLIVIAVVIRWIWPKAWNGFLKKIEANIEEDINSK